MNHAAHGQAFAGGEQCGDALDMDCTGRFIRAVLRHARAVDDHINPSEVRDPVILQPRGSDVERYPLCGRDATRRCSRPSRNADDPAPGVDQASDHRPAYQTRPSDYQHPHLILPF